MDEGFCIPASLKSFWENDFFRPNSFKWSLANKWNGSEYKTKIKTKIDFMIWISVLNPKVSNWFIVISFFNSEKIEIATTHFPNGAIHFKKSYNRDLMIFGSA